MDDGSTAGGDDGIGAVRRQAEAIASQLDHDAATFDVAVAPAAAEYEALLQRVAQLGPAYAFDRTGRPFAIEAVRQALPVVERELFDAILDDFACERAAIEEGLYRIAIAVGRRARSSAG